MHITGRLIHFNTRTTVMDYSELIELEFPDNKREIIPDSSGNFTISFRLQTPNYFRLGRNVLYITPGSSMKIEINNNAPEKSIFLGSCNEENNYLKKIPLPKAGSYLDGGLNVKLSMQKTIDTVLNLANAMHEKLKALKNVPSEFVTLENARIDADILNSFEMMATFYVAKFNTPESKQREIFKIADSLVNPIEKKYFANLVNHDFLKIEAFRRVCYLVDDIAGVNKSEQAEIKDWEYATSLYKKISATRNKADLQNLKKGIDSIKNATYRGVINETYKLRSEFSDGDEAKNFTASDKDGNKIKIDSYKGKLIFIDVWATWCGPCIDEMPYLEKLKKQYKDNPNIIFISLCVNDNFEKWQNNIKKNNRQGIQLFAESSQVIPYKFISLPRTIIISKSFRILKLSGPMPSDPFCEKYLDQVLKAEQQ